MATTLQLPEIIISRVRDSESEVVEFGISCISGELF